MLLLLTSLTRNSSENMQPRGAHFPNALKRLAYSTARLNDCFDESIGDKDEQNPHLFICKCYSFSGIAGIICSVSLDLVIILSHTHSKGGSHSTTCDRKVQLLSLVQIGNTLPSQH